MTYKDALDFLSQCTQEELYDRTFGDAEVYWFKDGEEVASAYFGRDVSEVVISETHKFEGVEADALRHVYKSCKCERNDGQF